MIGGTGVQRVQVYQVYLEYHCIPLCIGVVCTKCATVCTTLYQVYHCVPLCTKCTKLPLYQVVFVFVFVSS